MSPPLMQLGFALSGVGKSDHHDVKSQDKHTQNPRLSTIRDTPNM